MWEQSSEQNPVLSVGKEAGIVVVIILASIATVALIALVAATTGGPSI